METNKKIIFNNDARMKILEGVEMAANVAACTLGPRGRLVLIERPGQAPHLTKDGISTIKVLNLKDQFANLGVQMVKEASSQTVDVCGDGTTSCAILTHAIYKEGLKLISAGFNPVDLKKGIDKATEIVLSGLDSISVPVSNNEDIKHVATISANGDKEIGELLLKAVEKVGPNGKITVEESKNYKTTLDFVEGMQINRGFVSPFFITNNDKQIAELQNPYVLITNKKFEHMSEILSFLEEIYKMQSSLLIIVDEIEGEALHSLTANKMKGKLNVCVIRAPEFGNSRYDALSDIAVLTGGKIISDATGIKMSDINLTAKGDDIIVGKVDKVIVGKSSTTIIAKNNRKSHIDLATQELNKALEDPTLSEDDVDVLKRRLNRMSGGVAVIRVGGTTEVEVKEKKDRVDDALCAMVAAISEGIVSGGGTALVHASDKIDLNSECFINDSERAGARVIKQACLAPLQRIVFNAGSSGWETIVEKIKNSNYELVWDASKETYVNFIESGIIDPVKVPKVSLENAASVAGILLTVECAIVEEEAKLFFNE